MTTIEELERSIADWDNNDMVEEDLHTLFDEVGKWHWCAVADEGRRIWNLMFKGVLEIEHGSAMDAVIAAVAAQSADGVWQAVAKVLGIEKSELETVCDYVYENQDSEYEIPEDLKMAGEIIKSHARFSPP